MLDSLAQGRAALQSHFNSSRCCPSRASLLTGLYPHQAGIGRLPLSSELSKRFEKQEFLLK